MKREGGQFQFRLRAGMGDWVDRAPWRIEWGGGSSIENPHFQRVHYCQLLVRIQLSTTTASRSEAVGQGSRFTTALHAWTNSVLS